MSKYLLDQAKEVESLVFGDINYDGVDAQDVLAVVSTWLRKTETTEKIVLSLNVSADEKLSTCDAIDIVDNYVSSKEFKILR